MMADVPELLCRILAAPAAVAVHSYAGGLWLALSAVAAGRAVVVARAELGVAAPGCSLSDLVASAGAHLEEVGTTNRASVAEYEAAVSSQTAAVLKFCPDAYCIVGDTESAEFEQLVGLTRERELTFIDALGAAPLVDLPPAIPWPHRSARASIAAGTDLAIVHGDGLVGGPACGILAGSRDIIRRITELRMFKAWQLDAPRSAALASSLRCYDEPLRGDVELPLLELLATPLENLRNRADRLAPQLAQAVGIDSAEVVPLQGHWNMAPTPDRSLASFGVALSPADGNLTVLKHRLECGPQPVFCRIEDNRLLLDLRTVFARQDQAIIEAVAGQAPVSAAAPPAPK
jgi:L-seryl-tRNA(Ser) seleniumtransferase